MNKWGILGLQETHESIEASLRVEESNPHFICFPNPGTANSAGTAIMILRDYCTEQPVEDIKHNILIPGRAHSVTLNWKGREEITIVNVYAPNRARDAIDFFRELAGKLPSKVDFILGDFNHIENAHDRLPNRGPPSEE